MPSKDTTKKKAAAIPEAEVKTEAAAATPEAEVKTEAAASTPEIESEKKKSSSQRVRVTARIVSVAGGRARRGSILTVSAEVAQQLIANNYAEPYIQ